MMKLSDIQIEPFVRSALLEDLGRGGDITSQALILADKRWHAALVAREAGVVAGLDLARLSFQVMDKAITWQPLHEDGDRVQAGDELAAIEGFAHAILGAERTALNFLSHLSGIASATHKLVEAVPPYKTKICCTRKTTPLLRSLEKYAVRVGGGVNHRFGLDDAILIKDNHIAVCGGVVDAVRSARASIGHMTKIEVEVDTLDQLQLLLDQEIDAVLLDNMTPEMMKEAVAMVDGRFVLEASGKVSLDNIAAIAATGVDMISVGWITHSAPILDIGLDPQLTA